MLGPQFVVPHFPLKSWFGASRTLNQFKSSNTFCFGFRIRRKTQKSCRINPLHSASWEKLCNWVARQLCFSIQHFYLRFKMLAKYSLCTCVYPCMYFCCNLRVKKKNNIDWIAAIPAHWGCFFRVNAVDVALKLAFCLMETIIALFTERISFVFFPSRKRNLFYLCIVCIYPPIFLFPLNDCLPLIFPVSLSKLTQFCLLLFRCAHQNELNFVLLFSFRAAINELNISDVCGWKCNLSFRKQDERKSDSNKLIELF